MGKKIEKLIQSKIVALAPKAKPYRVADGGGLWLLVSTAGGKSWQGRYKQAGSEQTVSLGQWPVISLKRAREEWLKICVDRTFGIDPAAERRKVRAARLAAKTQLMAKTFGDAWKDWIELRKESWGESRLDGVTGRHKKWLQASLDPVPISAPDLSATVLTAINAAVTEGKLPTAWILLGDLTMFAEWCIAARYVTTDFTIGLSQLIPPRPETVNHPALVDPREVGLLMRDLFNMTDVQGGVVRRALLLSAIVFLRPAEVRNARWSDIDFATNEWRLSTKTKGKRKLIMIVPLSNQAVDILREQKALTGDRGDYVFLQNLKDELLTHDIMRLPLEKMGYGKTQSLHGFRATARTILEEHLRQDSRYIEMQLGHKVKDSNGTAYNRTKFLEDRRIMMQLWADWVYQFNTATK